MRGTGSEIGCWREWAERCEAGMPPPISLDTSMGIIKAEIYLDRQSTTASNSHLVTQDSTRACTHRVIPGFMTSLAARTPRTQTPVSGTGGPSDYTFNNRRRKEKRFNGGTSGDREHLQDQLGPGTLSMASTASRTAAEVSFHERRQQC